MRHRRVAAAGGNLDLEQRLAGHHRSRARGKRTNVHARHIVHAIDRIDREPLEQPIGDHRRPALAVFLGRLEDKHRPAIELAIPSQMLCSTQEHGRMPVMPAGMHYPLMAGSMRERVLLNNRQGIHIGPQPYARRAIAAL